MRPLIHPCLQHHVENVRPRQQNVNVMSDNEITGRPLFLLDSRARLVTPSDTLVQPDVLASYIITEYAGNEL